MAVKHVLAHALIFGAAANHYLFLAMISFSPRVWGYADYPEPIKKKVPAQTRKEKSLAAIIALPWFALVLGFPLWSGFAMKANLGGHIPFGLAFLDAAALIACATLLDLVVLDWLIVSRITPRFVIIPGSDKADYKDFSHHYRGHLRAVPPLTGLCLLIAGIVCLF